MATYYDGLNDFHKLNELERFATSAQIVYLHLLHLNNRNGNSGYVQVTDRELGYRTSLDKSTVTKAKQILKNRGLIDFKTNRNNPRAGTSYSLCYFLSEITTQSVGQSIGQNSGQTPGGKVGQSVGQTSRLTIKQPMVFCLDKRISSSLKEKERDMARARNLNECECNLNVAQGGQSFGEGESQARANTAVMDVYDLWEYETGYALHGSTAYELEVLEKRFGREAFHKALMAAVAGNTRNVSFKYFKAVLENQMREKQGSVTNGKRQEIHYSVPVYTGNEPWNKRRPSSASAPSV